MHTNHISINIKALFFLVLLGNAVLAQKQKQKIDSLQKVLQTAKDTARVNALNELAAVMLDVNSDFKYVDIAIKEAEELNYIKGMVRALEIKATLHWYRSEWNKWGTYLEKVIELKTKNKITDGLVSDYIFLGMSLQAQCKNEEAIKSLRKAELLLNANNDPLQFAEIYSITAQLHHTNGDYEKAFEYYNLAYKKAFEIKDTASRRGPIQGSRLNFASFYESIEDYETAAEYYNTVIRNRVGQSWRDQRLISRMYFNNKRYDSALVAYTDYLKSYDKHRPFFNDTVYDKTRVLTLNGFIGSIHNKMGNYQKALEYLLPLYKYSEAGGVYSFALSYLLEICQAYTGLRDYDNGLHYSKKLVQFAEENGVRVKLRDGYQSLATIYAAKGDVNNAHKYLKKYSDLKDSINTDELRSRLKLYRAEERETNKQSSIEQLKKEKRSLTIGIVLLAISLASIFSFIWLQRKYNTKKRLLQEKDIELKQAEDERRMASLEMMALRSQMNPHFIFNCLNSINRFVLRNDNEAASNYLTKFSKLMRMVLENSKQALIPLLEEVKCLELYIQMEQFRCKNAFTYYIRYHDGVNMDEALIPPLLLQPFVENAIWHGLNPKEGDGKLGIEFFQKEDALYCIIKDNGIGRKKASELKSMLADSHKSLGLEITKDRLSILGDHQSKEPVVEVEDLHDENGMATGTKVMIRIYTLPAFEDLRLSLNL